MARPKTIMIIDDNDDVRTIAARMAARLGLKPVIITHAALVNDDWKSIAVDLVLTDIFMPGKSGLEVITEMKEEHPDVPVMAMSAGWSNDGEKEDALRAAVKLGACETVLRKPFTKEEFAAAMRGADML